VSRSCQRIVVFIIVSLLPSRPLLNVGGHLSVHDQLLQGSRCPKFLQPLPAHAIALSETLKPLLVVPV
jgi:hypothetical protein